MSWVRDSICSKQEKTAAWRWEGSVRQGLHNHKGYKVFRECLLTVFLRQQIMKSRWKTIKRKQFFVSVIKVNV